MRGVAVSPDGSRVHFDVLGAGAPALVLVHGWSCDRTYWSPQVDHFAKRRLVVAIDLAGHGESGGDRQAWTMGAFGDDVVAVVETLDLSEVVLIGHSMGGDVVVEAALRIPERVVGLVWVDTYRTLGAPRSREHVDDFVDAFRRDFVPATRDFVRQRFGPDAPPELVERVAADMSAAAPEVALDALRHAVTNDGSILAGLRELAVPVVAINPDDGPTDTETLQRYGVATVLMSGVGHFPMLEDPDAFNRVLAETVETFA